VLHEGEVALSLRWYAETETTVRVASRRLLAPRVEAEGRVRDHPVEQHQLAGFQQLRVTEETNRLRREQRAAIGATNRELERVNREIQKVIEAIKAGFALPELKTEMDALQNRKKALVSQLAAADDPSPPPALHPQMAEVFRQKTMQLVAGLEHQGEHDTARQALRGFLEKIVIPPGNGLLQVVGSLGQMLKAADGRNGSAAVANVGCGGGI
jgi:site-specific DNA recombinase